MFLVIILTLFIVYIIHFYWKVRQYPNGPTPLPLIGNMHQIRPDELHVAVEEYKKTYGGMFTIWFMTKPTVMLTDYDFIKEALVTKGDILADRSGEYPEDIFKTVENGGVIFSSGDNWREQRRASLHILRDFGVGKNIMETMIQDQIKSLFAHIDSNGDKEAFDFRWSIHVMVANIINLLLYGYAYPHNNCKRLINYTESLDKVFSEMGNSYWPVVAMVFPSVKHLPYIGYKAYGQHSERYNYCISFVEEDVENALEGYSIEYEPNCYVQAYKQRMNNNEYLDTPNLLNNCCDFFFAGMETTSVSLRWSVLYLAKYPQIQENMRKEIAKEIGFVRLPSLSDKTRLVYNNAVQLEIQRHANIFPTSLKHKANQDVTIGGTKFKKGTHFLPSIRCILYDEKIFKEPLEFNPDRFLESDGITLKQELINKMVPFGLGKRACAGEGLAKNELFLVTTALVQKYIIRAPKDGSIDMSPNYGTVTFPNTNLLRLDNVDSNNYKQ